MALSLNSPSMLPSGAVSAEVRPWTVNISVTRLRFSTSSTSSWGLAPQGEVLYDVSLAGGRIAHCHPRSASFHNLVLMHEVFCGDILTDFPFIEASFGLSVAGVAL